MIALVMPMHKVESGDEENIKSFLETAANHERGTWDGRRPVKAIIANDGHHHGHGTEINELVDRLGLQHRYEVMCANVPPTRKGLAEVYRCGVKAALSMDASIIVEVDAGGSHSPKDLRLFLDKIRYFEVVFGCRFGSMAAHLGSWQRRELSRWGTYLTNAAFGTSFGDATSGYIAYRHEAAEKLFAHPFQSRGHYYQTELRLRAVRQGWKTAEVPIRYTGGQSSTLNQSSIKEALRLTFAQKYGGEGFTPWQPTE